MRSFGLLWSRAGRVPFDVVLLLLLPLVLLLFDPQWLYTGMWLRDAWSYHGYFLDLPGQLRLFPDNYPGSRLTVLLPGWLAYRVLPPAFAVQVMHLAVYYGMVFGLFAVLRAVTDRRAAGLVALLFGTQGFVLISATSDYADGYVIAYFLVAAAALTRAGTSRRPALWLIAAGTAAMAMVVANLFFVVLLPLLGVFHLALNRGRVALVPALCWCAVGAGGLLLALGAVNVALGGRFLFLLPSISYAGQHGLVTANHPIRLPLKQWLPRAGYLVIPLACSLGAALFLARRAWRDRADLYLQLQLLGLVVLLLGSTLHPGLVLAQCHFYVVPLLLPAAMMALGAQWRGRLDSLSGVGFGALLIGVAVVGGLSHRAAVPGVAPTVPVCFVLTALGITLPLASVRWLPLALSLIVAADCAVHRRYNPFANYPDLPAFRRIRNDVREWDSCRGETFRAIDQAMRLAGEARGDGPCWFSFDMDDRYACLFDRIACYHCYRTGALVRIAGRFPRFAPMSPNAVWAVLSSDPDYYHELLPQLAAQHRLTARVVAIREVRSGAVRFTLTLLTTEPLPKTQPRG